MDTLTAQSKKVFSGKLKAFCARDGFGMMEALVAVAVLLSAIAAVLTVSQKSLGLTGVSRNKIIAFYLAQEPFEYIHNVRDSNRLAGVPIASWLSGLGSCSPGPCTIDVTNHTVAPCSSGCPLLRRDTGVSERYGYTPSWDPSPYTRAVTINEFAPAREATVTVVMTWQEGTRTKTLSVQNNILAWGF